MAHERAIAAAAGEVVGRRVEDVRALTGGISNLTYLVRLAAPGEPHAVVVRVFADRRRAKTEAAALRLVEGGAVKAPRLLGEGRIHSTGWLVIVTRIPGRPIARPNDGEWIERLAGALAAIHGESRRTRALATDAGSARPWIDDPPPPELGAPARTLWPAIGLRRDELGEGPVGLVHGDFHAGNLHWVRGRVSGVLDWEMARWGPPAADVAYCFMDLALASGRTAARQFLAAYTAQAGGVQGFDAWLLMSLLRPLPDPAVWLPSYEGAGLTGLTATALRRRYSSLVRAVC